MGWKGVTGGLQIAMPPRITQWWMAWTPICAATRKQGSFRESDTRPASRRPHQVLAQVTVSECVVRGLARTRLGEVFVLPSGSVRGPIGAAGMEDGYGRVASRVRPTPAGIKRGRLVALRGFEPRSDG